MDEIKKEIESVMRELSRVIIETLGSEDTEFLFVLKKGDLHTSVCTNGSFDLSQSIILNILDEDNEGGVIIYDIIKTVAAGLLLCKDMPIHKDFEDAMSDLLMESLSK